MSKKLVEKLIGKSFYQLFLSIPKILFDIFNKFKATHLGKPCMNMVKNFLFAFTLKFAKFSIKAELYVRLIKFAITPSLSPHHCKR